MDIILASNNKHKHDEFARLFPGHRILLPKDVGVDFSFEENGKTFLENALGKAMTLFALVKKPVVSDDSGLCVDALGGEPGIFSSRYGATDGKLLETPQRNDYLLSRIRGVADRKAYFVCCMVLVLEESRFFTAQETVHGEICESPRGEHGFGYDPLFVIPGTGKTIAELPDAKKDLLSHRGRAARRIAAVLENGA